MRGKIFSLIAASAVAFTVVCLPQATNLSATSCDDIKFIFARGSGQELEDEDYLAFKSSIITELSQQNSTLSVGFYELGSVSQNGAKYPAVALDFFTVLGSKVSSGNAFKFGESVKEGISELKNYIETTSAMCPYTEYVISGYSQGAMVVTNGLKELNPEKIIYAATFGDPKLYLPEGKGKNPDACSGKNLSIYRIYAPNCYTYQGSLSGKKPYLDTGWYDKVGLWCKDQDLVCGAGFSFGEPKTEGNFLENIVQSALHAHTRYPDDDIYELAAETIVEKIHNTHSKNFNLQGIFSQNQDTVILLNTSGAMYGYMNYHRKVAAIIAEETIKRGGRVALWTYGDLYDRKAAQVLDFTTNYSEFSSYLWSLGSMLDGDSDRKSSYLSAVQDVLNTTTWRANTDKSIIALTITPARVPDLDGTSEEMVENLAHEKGNVNLYVITPFEENAIPYQKITKQTGGDIFWNIDVNNVTLSSAQLTVASKAEQLENKATSKDFALDNFQVVQKGNSVTVSFTPDENIYSAFVSLDDSPLGFITEGSLEITNITKNTTLNLVPLLKNGTFSETISGEITYITPSSSTLFTPQTGKK